MPFRRLSQQIQVDFWLIQAPYDREALLGVIAIMLGLLFNIRNYSRAFLVALCERRMKEKKGS